MMSKRHPNNFAVVVPQDIIEHEIKCFKRFREAIRLELPDSRSRMCYELSKYGSAFCYNIVSHCGSTTWKYRLKGKHPEHIVIRARAYPIDRIVRNFNYWEPTSWFYRVHLLSHCIREMEKYLESVSE